VPYQVKLEVFEGPMDLLLHLITRQRVDIYEVSLASITDDYLSALEGMQDLDLETATGFLVVAATLLELKSSRLLPSRGALDEADAQLLEERDRLLARLVECATFREAGHWIQVGLEGGATRHPARVPMDPEIRAVIPEVKLKVSVADLLRAADRVFNVPPAPSVDVSHMSTVRVSVREAIEEIATFLQGAGTVTFEELCRGRDQRLEIVVRFLGLLELLKAGAVDLAQEDRFGSIRATWTGDIHLGQVLDEVDEYSVSTEGKI
jgi:segregation and condensation protein A